jgi:hypothetical protein
MEDSQKDIIQGSYQKPNVHIRIGGDVGSGVAMGSENSVDAQYIVGGNLIMGSIPENATSDDFVELLQQIQMQIDQLQEQFIPDDATDAKDALTKLAQMSKRDEPPVDRMKHNLDTIREIVDDTAKTSAAIAPLILLVQHAWTMFMHLFGG